MKRSVFNRIHPLLIRRRLDTYKIFCHSDSSVGDIYMAREWSYVPQLAHDTAFELRTSFAFRRFLVVFPSFPFLFLSSTSPLSLLPSVFLLCPLRAPRTIASGFRVRSLYSALARQDNGTLCSWTTLPRESRSFTSEHSCTLLRDDMFAGAESRDERRTFTPSRPNLQLPPVPGRCSRANLKVYALQFYIPVSAWSISARVLVKIISKYLINALKQIIR